MTKIAKMCMFRKKLKLAKFESFQKTYLAYVMMHTISKIGAKYLVCWFVSFRKHSAVTHTLFCFLLYYVERSDI